jgi:hypothetical protein
MSQSPPAVTPGTVATSEVETPPAAPPKKPRKSGCGCFVPLLLLIGVVGFAPQILTMTVLRHQVPAMLISALPPGVVIGSATAGWTTPIQLNDVVIPDDHGQPNLKLKHLTLSKSIWELATGTDDLGKIDVEKPDLNLVVENGVTNYDKLIERLTSKKGSGKRKLIELKLTEGVITVREAAAKSAEAAETEAPETSEETLTPSPSPGGRGEPEEAVAIVDLKSATFRSLPVGEEELYAEISASLREPKVEQPITAEMHWNLPEREEPGIGSGKVKAAIPSMPLAVLSPWLSPLAGGRGVAGVASLNVNVEALPTEKELLLGVQIEIPHLDLQLSPDATHPDPFRWVGDNLTLMAEGQGDLAGKQVKLETAQLRTPLLNADFKGTLLDLPGSATCDLAGTCNLNPQDLLAALPSEWSQHVQISGLKLGQIRVQGDLRPQPEVVVAPGAEAVAPTGQPLHIEADVQWDTGNVLGFQSDNAHVSVDWSNRTLSLNPNHLPIGTGRWVASPRIEFAPQGRTLVFDGGPVFENVEFTPDMSNTWLKYVSPILGQATSIDGKFSLSAAPARVGLSAPWPGELSGNLDIQSARVSPGPLTRQIIEGVAGIQTMMGRRPAEANVLMTVEEQRVPFAFKEGRVYHKDLHVSMGDLVVSSAGSVGMDETLDVQISVPIPDKWTEGKPLLAGLKGEVLPFPMGGTLDHPVLDGQALGEFGKRIGFKSAGGLLEQLIQKRLEKKANGELPAQRPKPKRVR